MDGIKNKLNMYKTKRLISFLSPVTIHLFYQTDTSKFFRIVSSTIGIDFNCNLLFVLMVFPAKVEHVTCMLILRVHMSIQD